MIGKANIFLIGPMGSGKTAVGRQLARLLDVPFHDSDAEIEIEAIDALTRLEPIVMATGGGAELRPENRQLLSERGTVVFLATSLGQQLHRVGSGKGRPLLHTADLPARLSQLRAQRDPIYRQLADYVVSTDHRRVARVAEQILHDVCGRTVSPAPPDER